MLSVGEVRIGVGIGGALCMSSWSIEAGQRVVGFMVLSRAPNPGVNGVTSLKEISSAKLRESVSNSGILYEEKQGLLGLYIELI